MKILIVEDVELNLELLVQLLEDDHELITADNGAEAVEITRRERPDLVLMDMSLPVMDGWSATRAIKADAELAHIHVIALTAHAMKGDEERAREAGCDDYISKPLDEDVLVAKLASLAESAAP